MSSIEEVEKWREDQVKEAKLQKEAEVEAKKKMEEIDLAKRAYEKSVKDRINGMRIGYGELIKALEDGEVSPSKYATYQGHPIITYENILNLPLPKENKEWGNLEWDEFNTNFALAGQLRNVREKILRNNEKNKILKELETKKSEEKRLSEFENGLSLDEQIDVAEKTDKALGQ
jgi:hypothetical protein